MAQAKGYRGRVVIDYETSFGVAPVVPNGISVPFNTMEVVGKQNLIDPATITGTRNPVAPGKGNLSVDGSIVIPFDNLAIGYWLKGIMGTPTTTGAAAPYSHVFKVGDSQPSMVLEKGFQDITKYMLYKGCKVSTFKVTFGGDGELTASMDVMGARETIGATQYDDTPTDAGFNRLNNFQVSIEEGGVSIATVTNMEFTINAGLDGNQYTIGSQGTRGDIPEGVVSVTGNLKALFTDTTLLDKGVNNTESQLKLVVAQDANNSVTFEFPEVIYERNSPGISGPGGVLVDLNWRAYWNNDAGNSACIITVKNAKATY